MYTSAIDIGNDFLTQHWLPKVSVPAADCKGISTSMLRLDLIHPLVSGNKWLKLNHWIKRYNTGNYQGIITAGGPWSNYLHASAYACYLGQIPMKAMVKGHPNLQNAMLNDLNKWGCEVQFLSRNEFYNHSFLSDLADSMNYLLIPMGGEGDEGEAGVRDWFNQLPLPHFDYIFCAIGTGTTVCGIAKSQISYKTIIAVDPGTGDEKLTQKLENLNNRLENKNILKLAGGKKIGRLTPETDKFMQDWFEHTGIPLDFVYTAPLCQAFVKMLQAQQIPEGSSVLLIHTGGLQGNRSLPNLPI